MKNIFILLILLISILSCSDSKKIAQDDDGQKVSQLELVNKGLLTMDEDDLSPDQKQLKSQLYQLILEHVSVDTTANHLELSISKSEFEKVTGLDMSMYIQLEDEITAINNYADSTGLGEQMMASWTKSKEAYIKKIRHR